jgi:hypothetical protein
LDLDAPVGRISKEGLDAHADRMKIVVEDFDTGFYVAFDPGD